jgi:hypothetical protein
LLITDLHTLFKAGKHQFYPWLTFCSSGCSVSTYSSRWGVLKQISNLKSSARADIMFTGQMDINGHCIEERNMPRDR